MTWTISGNVYLYFGFIISSACIVIDSSIGDYNERVRYHWFLPWATITRCRFCFCPCELKILLECHDVCPPYSKCVELTMSSTRKPVLSHQSLADLLMFHEKAFIVMQVVYNNAFFSTRPTDNAGEWQATAFTTLDDMVWSPCLSARIWFVVCIQQHTRVVPSTWLARIYVGVSIVLVSSLMIVAVSCWQYVTQNADVVMDGTHLIHLTLDKNVLLRVTCGLCHVSYANLQ